MVKTYLVSGITSGIGKCIYDKLINNDQKVIPIIREKINDIPEYVFLNYKYPSQVEGAFYNFNNKIDCFINCAAAIDGKTLFETDFQDMENLININLVSVMAIISKIKDNINNDGSIILLGSNSGYVGSYDDVYAVTKGGIHTLVKTLAKKLAPNIRIIGIAPGIVSGTNMTDTRYDFDELHNRFPMKQLTKAEDVAELALFLTSDACKNMTGNIVEINGGI